MSDRRVDMALAFLESQPAAAAAVLEQLPVDEVVAFLADVPHGQAAALAQMLPQHVADVCLKLPPATSANHLSEMEPDRIAAILRRVDPSTRSQVLELLPERTRRWCRRLLRFAETTVGAWMRVAITTLPVECSVQNARERIASDDVSVDLDVIPVVDRDRQLRGEIDIATLLRAEPDASIRSIMTKRPDTISGRTALVAATDHPAWGHRDSIAVVDRNGQMAGVLRHVDLRRGLGQGSSQLARARTSGDVLGGVLEVYGRSLLALFGVVYESASMRHRGESR